MTSVTSPIPRPYSFLTSLKVTFFDDLCTHLRMRLHYIIVWEAGWPAMRYVLLFANGSVQEDGALAINATLWG